MNLNMLRSLWSTRGVVLPRSLLGNNTSLFGLRRNITRRGMASKSHQAASSDTPWIVGSTLLFGPILIYLLGPGSANVVTGHGDPSKDPHPSGHGAAPAPLMKKSIPQPGPPEVEEEDKSTHESEASSDNAEQADKQQSDTPNTSQKENENTETLVPANPTQTNKTSQADNVEISEEHQEDDRASTEVRETDSTDKDIKQNKAD